MGTHRLSFAEEVLQKIEQLRSMDAALKLFGAGAHRYRFNPPLEPEAVAAFEASQALRLPEDYRDFILNVGNGGAGPCYGIYPFLSRMRETGTRIERCSRRTADFFAVVSQLAGRVFEGSRRRRIHCMT